MAHGKSEILLHSFGKTMDVNTIGTSFVKTMGADQSWILNKDFIKIIIPV